MQHSKLSIVILSYNSLQLLSSCIQSIYNFNDIGNQLEIIVCDNASANQQEIGDFLRNNFPKVSFIPNAQNHGYGAGNNVGIRACTSDIVMLMNPDVTLHEPVFSWALKVFNENKSQALFGFRQKNQNGRNVHSFLLRRLTVRNFWFNWLYQKINRFNPEYSVIAGACFFLDKTIFLKAGAYDESIFLYGEERFIHEKIRKLSPSALISMNFAKSYLHPISDREFSLKTVNYGLKSYFYLQKLLGISPQKTFAEVLRYYKFLVLFYRVKNKNKVVNQTKLVIALLKSNFNSTAR